MLLIYVDKISERLIYTLDFVFKDREIDYKITNDWYFFQNSTSPKFIYSERFAENHFQILPSSLLFDEGIFVYSLQKSLFFQEDCLSINKICDPLASIFYVLSRHEEYTNTKRDEHGRFEASNSILFQFAWLQKVVCDRWAEDLIKYLELKLNTKLNTKQLPLELIPSFDIDNTFAFQWKDGLRKKLSSWKDKFKKDSLRIEARKEFEAGKIKDPYDTFESIKKLKKLGFKTRIFWLLGEYSKFDKNISANDNRHQALIAEMANYAEIGLHPSYESNMSLHFLKNEKEILEKILKNKVNSSRQHFLKLSFPSTYNSLIQMGFTDDYTMGFSDQIGFRAGTTRPYRFFDLMTNSSKDFWIHPFAYMDGTLNQYLKLNPEEAKAQIKILFDEVKLFGGEFIFLWHNETISEFGIWKGWKDVFDYTINLRNEI